MCTVRLVLRARHECISITIATQGVPMQGVNDGLLTVRRVGLLIMALILAPLGGVGGPQSALAASTVKLFIKGAGTVIETTDARRINCSSPSTTPTGVVGQTCTASYGDLWNVSLAATPAVGYTFAGWRAVPDPEPLNCHGHTNGFKASGPCGFTAPFPGSPGMGLEALFEDRTSPVITSLNGPPSTSSSRTAQFSFLADQAGSTFRCQLDGEPYVPCTSGFTRSNLIDGIHTFRVYAVDPSSNVSLDRSQMWQVDASPPEVSLTAPPADTWLRGTVVVQANASDGSGVGVQRVEFQRCAADGGGCDMFSADLTAPYATNLDTTSMADGRYALRAVAVDRLGNRGTSAPRTILLDRAKPAGTVTINGGKAATTNRKVRLSIKASGSAQDSKIVQMRLRNGGTKWSAWRPFKASTAWTLAKGTGKRKVQVQVRDTAGNMSAPATDVITVKKKR
jgi:hypothetical protein